MNKLNEIQQKLRAPKSQRNSFGNYNYRSCEDILEAVKPLLGEATLILGDEIVEVGGRVYVKATACLTDSDTCYTAQAFAREALTKKGQDDAQITGSASSYARKYALNGLFCIDDNKDADTRDNSADPYQELCDKHAETIKATKDCIYNEDLHGAYEVWNELDRETQIALWKAPSKGGCFTTEERKTIKSDEWAAIRKESK